MLGYLQGSEEEDNKQHSFEGRFSRELKECRCSSTISYDCNLITGSI
jgi:hypothetical protein